MSRSADLRARDRRVLAWALAIAAAVHVVAFLYWPAFHADPLTGSDADVRRTGSPEGMPIYVEVAFGAPEILEPDGTISNDSPQRTLQAARVIRLDRECASLGEPRRTPPRGKVRLRLNAEGYAALVSVTESTGDACGDEVIGTVADALWYRWLPNERFSAPLDLLQPVTLLRAGT